MLWLGIEGRKKIKALETRCNELEESLERYVRACKQLETEWIDTLDRVNHFMGRAAARQRRAGKEPVVDEWQHDPELAHLDPLSRQIVLQRRGWGKNGSGQ